MRQWLAPCLIGLMPLAALAQSLSCTDLTNHYGPFDYRKNQHRWERVETHHFTPAVESLLRGVSGPIGGEIDYTLHVFPNHPRALLAMERLARKEKADPPRGAMHTVECYYTRALVLAPDDTVARLLFAQFLDRNGRRADAMQHLQATEQFAGDNGFTHFNIGMVYLEFKEYDRALRQAHLALQYGFERPGLREGLVKAGKWRDPEPPQAAAAPAAAAPAAAGAAAAPAQASAPK